jgi:hypothetical protein
METLWTVAMRGGDRTGLDAAAVMALLWAGEITPGTLVCRAGHTQWVALQRDPELALALARAQHAAAGAARPAGGRDPGATPPPAPGEPWFYNVAPGRAILLDVVSVGFYSLVWAYRHRSWLERRAGPITSPFWQFRFDKWLPGEVASAAERVGVQDRVKVELAPINDALLVLSALCFCLLPIVLVIGFSRFSQLQNAAEVVNQAVAPGAPRPPMDVGEWASVLVGLGIWIGLPLLFVLNILLQIAAGH